MAMKTLILTILISFFSFQENTTANIGQALKAGSSKELIKYCNNNIEIKIDGKGANYSLNQAEEVLKNFFLKNPARNFTYIHQGQSPEGLKYNIGSYKMDNGSYRVVMVIKQISSELKIDTITFSKE